MVKAADLPATQIKEIPKPAAGKPPVRPPRKRHVRKDAFEGKTIPAQTESQRLRAAVEAAKAAQAGPGRVSQDGETPSQQFLRGLLGKMPAKGLPGSDGSAPGDPASAIETPVQQFQRGLLGRIPKHTGAAPGNPAPVKETVSQQFLRGLLGTP